MCTLIQHKAKSGSLVAKEISHVRDENQNRVSKHWDNFTSGLLFLSLASVEVDQSYQQVRLVSAKAERPNHPSRGGGGSASQGGS